MNSSFVLSLSSSRVIRSIWSRLLSNKWMAVTGSVLGILFFITGVTLIAYGTNLGWLLLIPASWVVVGIFWYRGNLASIPVGNFQSQGAILLHEALEPEVLAKIKGTPGNMSAYDIWKILEQSEERFFIHNRYLIDSSFFENLLSREGGSDIAVWNNSQALYEKHGSNGYTNALVFTALIASAPNTDQMLRSIGLEFQDIETSIEWMGNIKEKRKLAKEKKKLGSIGRDWAYGYTPILKNLGHNISEGIEKYGFFSDTKMHEPIVQQMIQVLESNSTITLVGDEGVGKTTCVYALAERLLADSNLPKNIRYNQIVELDASTLIANAKRPGELEDLMIHIFNEAHRAKNITLFFDEAHAFFGDDTGNVNLSHVLQPVLESGSVRIILAMNPQNWQQLARSGVATRLKPINVPAADEKNTIGVLRDKIGTLEYKHKLTYTYQSLHEAYKLGTRYVNTQSMPGAAMSVLEQAATNSNQQLITREVVQQAIERAYGIKLQTASNSESSDLLNLEQELRSQVISQDRAVGVISNALIRARSGVGNPDRPIGTFLFLGPTGVGKTELSKALARSYFNDENALIRVDMNQFVSAQDVNRLIAAEQGMELGFLGEVRKRPFSVILFDEIEKAHSSVINALLQMLDEGMMKDSDNRSVSFRDAIIIATSNAGADEIRSLIDQGQNIEDLEATFVDTLISKGSFAPEFVNRFDEVVLFRPLSQDDLVKVIDLILEGVNKTLDPQKVRVELTDQAKRWLVSKGYDSKLGARPMRRMTQRYVENIVAKRILGGSVQPGGVVHLDTADFEISEN